MSVYGEIAKAHVGILLQIIAKKFMYSYKFYSSLVGENPVHTPGLAEHGSKGQGESDRQKPSLGLNEQLKVLKELW